MTDSTAVDVNVFSDIYNTLYMGRTTLDTINFPKFNTVAQNWVNERLKTVSTQNTIALAGLYYNYARISPTALQENKIRVVDSTYYTDSYINGVWQNPYETANAVAFAPPINNFNKKEFDVTLPEIMMLSNNKSAISKIELDGADGNGYSLLQYGQPVRLRYSSVGTYKWTFRVTLADQSILYAYSVFTIHDDIPAEITNADVPGAKLRIDHVPGHGGQIRRPFIVVEGFDPGHIIAPEKEGGETTLNDFYESLLNSFQLFDLLHVDGTPEYDVIYVDWDNGTADLRDNSEVLEDVINWVNDNKVGDEDIVILGQSMGGVITRYTLAKMEQDNDPRDHHVRTFISHDAPHQGSNTLLSGQVLARHMCDEYVASPFTEFIGEDLVPVIFTFADAMASALNSLADSNLTVDEYVSPESSLTIQDRPAAFQMNYYWYTPTSNITSNAHNAWQAELEAMGYPQDSYNIAISNGNECGEDQGFEPGVIMAEMHRRGSKAFFTQYLVGMTVPYIGFVTRDTELTLLGYLTGSSQFYFDFELRALPNVNNNNDRNIYKGKLRYAKKFLYLATIWYEIFKRNVDAPAFTLPLDSYPGGNFDISSYSDDLPGVIPSFIYHNPVYNFIPVVSALDVQRSNSDAPALNDYIKAYGVNTMPDSGLTTPFDSFLVENNPNEPFNGEHITFQARTGNWIAQELDVIPGNNAAFNCSFACATTEIAGPDWICSLGGSFSVPPGADSYAWNVIGGNIVTVTSGLNSNSITVERNGANSGWIQIGVRIDSERCDVEDLVLVKDVYIGAPTVESVSYINTSSGGGSPGSGDDPEIPDNGPQLPMNPTLVNDGCEVYLEMHYTPGINQITDIEWQKVTTDISWSRDIVNHSGRYVYLYPTCNKPFTFRIRTKSDCAGWSQWQEFTHNITACTSNCSSGNSNSISSPNFYLAPVPADTELTISIRTNHTWSFPQSTTIIGGGGNPYIDPDNGGTTSNGSYMHPTLAINVTFFDSAGNQVLSTVTSGIPHTVNVSTLPAGLYVMVIEYQGQIESHNITIN
ncbi:MAG: hypothetical protein CMP77_04180 [Flavobacterium sp.]|nr:hypothetical protein [Flavobacterium sp.]